MNLSCLAVFCVVLIGQPDTYLWFKGRAAQAEALAKDGKKTATMEIVTEMEAQAAKAESKEMWTSYVAWQKGLCFYWLGDYPQAITILKDTETVKANRPFRHYIFRELGESYLDSGRTKKAEPYFQDALDHAAEYAKEAKKGPQFSETEKLRIQLLQVRCKVNLGNMDDAKERLTALEKKVFRKLDTKDELQNFAEVQAEWLILRAETDLNDRNVVGSLQQLETGQKILEEYPDNRKLVFLRFRCHLGLARDFWLLARFDNSDAHLKRAEALASSGKLYRTSLGLADIKNAFAGLMLERAHLAIEDDTPPAKILASLDQAEKNLEQALGHHNSVNPGSDMFTVAVDFHRAQLRELRGRALKASGEKAEVAQAQFQIAKKHCDEAIKQLKETLQLADDHDRLLEVRNRRAWINLRLRNANAARDEARAALTFFEGKHGVNHIDRGRYLHSLMEAENDLGNVAKAAEYAAEHRRLTDKGLATMLSGLSASEQVQFFRRWDTPGLHASLRLGVQHAKDHPEIAAASVEWLINGKAKLAEVIAAKAQATRASSKEAFASYQDSVTRQAYYLYGRPSNDEKIIQQLYLGEEATKRALATQAAKKLASEPHWYTLSEVQKNLRADEVYVGIYTLRPRDGEARVYHAWIIPQAGPVQTVGLGDAHEIEDLVKTFAREMDRVPSIAPGEERIAEERLKRTCLAELSRRVLHPIQKLAGGKTRWIISPDGPLWNIPWATLLLPNGQYAIDEMTFRYAITGQDLVQAQAAPAHGEPLVLGDPWFNAPDLDRQRLRKPGLDPLWLPWDRLEYSRNECAMVVTIMEKSKLKPNHMLGTMQKKQLTNLTLPPQIVYLSTHAFGTLRGSVDVDDPLLTCALAFAGWNYLPQASDSALPGMMTGAEVVGIDLRGTELVVLASCSGGREELAYGQSPANLRHAFHLAGARAVVSALWGINDKSTQELMEPFMEAICKQNADKVAALREAQQQSIRYLRMYRDHAHPFYWASFTISGS